MLVEARDKRATVVLDSLVPNESTSPHPVRKCRCWLKQGIKELRQCLVHLSLTKARRYIPQGSADVA